MTAAQKSNLARPPLRVKRCPSGGTREHTITYTLVPTAKLCPVSSCLKEGSRNAESLNQLTAEESDLSDYVFNILYIVLQSGAAVIFSSSTFVKKKKQAQVDFHGLLALLILPACSVLVWSPTHRLENIFCRSVSTHTSTRPLTSLPSLIVQPSPPLPLSPAPAPERKSARRRQS